MIEYLNDLIVDAAGEIDARTRRLALGAAKDEVFDAARQGLVGRAAAEALASYARRLIAAADAAMIAEGALPY
jgi:hypothetical protein